MFTVIPWEEYASDVFSGWLLQVRRSKRKGDLWGQIRTFTYDGKELTFVLDWITTKDPRQSGEVEKTDHVETVTITPLAAGPLYTDDSEFIFKDKSMVNYRIWLSYRLLKSTGRPHKEQEGPLNAVQPMKRRSKPRYKTANFRKVQ